MRAPSLLRPLAIVAACFSVMGSAVAETFENFSYTFDGTSVTITSHANVAVSSIVVPAEIDGLPVRTISMLRSASLVGSALLRANVTSITIPEGVTTIGPSAMSSFNVLQSITLPNSVTSVGADAFRNCISLTSATFGNGVTELTDTFEDCASLTTVNLPDQLVTLDGTFINCVSLTAIQIPASVTTLERAFRGCTNLTSMELPAGVTALGNETFSGCTSLQSVTLPGGLISIGGEAFSGCTGLTSLILPPALTTIGDNAFSNCTDLTSLIFPPSLTTIGSGAFSACTGLTSLNVPTTVTSIGDNAFWGCPNLTEVELPPHFLASIANIGLDHEPQVASDLLVNGIADRLANNPDFITKLADAIIAKTGHYGLSTQADITNVVNQTPQTVREVLAEVGAESPAVHGITSDLGTLTVKKGKPVQYTVTTTFSATAFAAIGLPYGVIINPTTGVISGKARKPGVYNVFLHAGVPGGGAVSAVKVITVTL